MIFAAGNGVGKTAATVMILAAIIWPDLMPGGVFQDSIFQNWPYPKDFRICSTPQQIAEGGSIQREISNWWPKGKYMASKAGKPYTSQYSAKDFTVSIMSYDMDPSAFEGANLGLVIFDEPPPRQIYNASVARLRRGGRLLFPGTPLMDAAWIMDELVSKADGKSIQLVHGDIHENCLEHSPGGLLKHSDIDRMLNAYDPDELAARKSGQFMHLSGRIYKNFDRSVHVAKSDIIPSAGGVEHYQVVDPAIGKPMACIWAFVDATGTISIYAEHPESDFIGMRDSNMTVKDYAALFQTIEHGLKIENRILDRHFGNVRRTAGGMTLKQEFSEAGVDFYDSYQVSSEIGPEIETGILKVKEYLSYDKSKMLDALNRPKLIISPKCKNTIAALDRWSRTPSTGKPKEEYKDFADVCRYLCMANPEIYEPAQWSRVGRMPHYGVGNT